MKLQLDGTPIIATETDAGIADDFAQKLADNLYGRLPKFVRMFLSRDALAALIRNAIGSLAQRAAGSTPIPQSPSVNQF